MKLETVNLYLVQIPLKKQISHNLKTWDRSESIVVSIKTMDGLVGYGEGAPRKYVIKESLEHISAIQEDLIHFLEYKEVNNFKEIVKISRDLREKFQLPSITCAVEMALLDLLGKQQNCPLYQLLSQNDPNPVTYSAVLPFVTPGELPEWLTIIQSYQFESIKIKVGTPNDEKVLHTVRNYLGDDIDIRLDANRAWNLDEAIFKIQSLSKFNISSIEEPLAAHQTYFLPALSHEIDIPIMLDESACSLHQVKYYVENIHAEKLKFNIKISKSGGLLNASNIFHFATSKNVKCQLGCNVGETAILSAAGRHFAQSHSVEFLEGSYSQFFMQDDISHENLNFNTHGNADLLRDSGLGIHIDEIKLKEYCHSVATTKY